MKSVSQGLLIYHITSLKGVSKVLYRDKRTEVKLTIKHKENPEKDIFKNQPI